MSRWIARLNIDMNDIPDEYWYCKDILKRKQISLEWRQSKITPHLEKMRHYCNSNSLTADFPEVWISSAVVIECSRATIEKLLALGYIRSYSPDQPMDLIR